MAIRVINYTVTKNGISPATMQRGGLQGEHCATMLNFNLDEEFKSELEVYSEKGGETALYYRFEAHTSTGLKNSTVPQELYLQGYGRFVTLEYPLENWLTRDGGNIRVYLIFSALNVDDGQTQVDLFSYPALLRLENVPEADYTDGQNYDSISLLSASAVNAAERAEMAAGNAKESETAADAARELTEQARFALESGAEFIFQGGDAKGAARVDIAVDDTMSEVSSNPVQNKVIAEALKSYSQEVDETFEANNQEFNEAIKTATEAAVVQAIAEAKLAAHPVGSYYFSAEATDPSILFGGEWLRIKDRFILAAGDTYTAGDEGGEAEVALSQAQLPNITGIIANVVTQTAGGVTCRGVFSPRAEGAGNKMLYGGGTEATTTAEKTDEVWMSFGENQPHNNMPPYIVAYCWRRIA